MSAGTAARGGRLRARLAETYAGAGALGVARALGRLALRPLLVYEKHVLLTADCAAPPTAPDRGVAVEGARVDVETMCDAGLIDAGEREHILGKLAAGQHLLVVRGEHAPLAYALVDLQRLWVAGRVIPLMPQQAYNDTNFVFPVARGRGLQAVLLDGVRAFAHRHGRRHCLSLTLSHNRASLRGHARGGFRPAGALRVVRLRVVPGQAIIASGAARALTTAADGRPTPALS